DQIAQKRWQAIVLTLQPVVLDLHVLAFDVASFGEAFAKRARIARVGLCRPVSINPTTGIADCCACAASGHVAAAPPSSVMHSRRLIRSPRRQPRAAYRAPLGRAPWPSLD